MLIFFLLVCFMIVLHSFFFLQQVIATVILSFSVSASIILLWINQLVLLLPLSNTQQVINLKLNNNNYLFWHM